MITSFRCTALLLVLSASCAQQTVRQQREPAPGGEVAPQRVPRRQNLITREELNDPAIVDQNAYQAIRQLRPAFFKYRGPTSWTGNASGSVQISEDFGLLQPIGRLELLDTRTIVEIRYLNAEEATLRFGIKSDAGPVIVLVRNKAID
jgi:hypothetical protein